MSLLTRAFAFLLAGSTLALAAGPRAYFPPSDSAGGWRTLTGPAKIRKTAQVDTAKLDAAFDYVQQTLHLYPN